MSDDQREVSALYQLIEQFLNEEERFLEQIRSTVGRIGRHPIGQTFSEEDVDRMIALRRATQARAEQRAAVRHRLKQSPLNLPDPPTIASVVLGIPELRPLQQRCDDIRRQTFRSYTSLQLAMNQLRESHATISVVLDAALGSQTDTRRYDATGKLMVRPGLVDERRVA